MSSGSSSTATAAAAAAAAVTLASPVSSAINTNSSSTSTPNAGGTTTKDESAASVLYKERDKKRLLLRASNLKVWQNGADTPLKTLDSNLKKNTAFVKRVKQSLAHDAKDQLLKDLPQLNLEKYLQELVHAIPEGLIRCTTAKDCFAAAEIISAFHARFGGEALALPLTQALSAALAPPNRIHSQNLPPDQRERDEVARLTRQRPLLRVTAELALIEIIGHTNDAPGSAWLYQTVKELLATDKEHANAPLLISLLKGLAPSLIDPPSSTPTPDADVAVEKMGNMTLNDAIEGQLDVLDPQASPLVSTAMKTKFRKLFETYYQTLARRISKEHHRLQEQDRKNHEAYIRSGEIFEDRQQNYEKMTKSFEKARDWGKALSDILGVPMPKLEADSKANTVGLGVNLDSRSAFERGDEEFVSDQSPWEDEDSRKFYEDLLDLGDIIPPAVLAQTLGVPSLSVGVKDDGSKPQDAAFPNAEVAEETSMVGSNTPEQSKSPKLQADTDAAEESISTGPAAQLNTLFARLPDMTNRTMIDSAAVDFAFIASKPARKKLVKHLAAVPRSRLDLIPYYARLTATLNRYMPDIGSSLVASLEEEFRYFQRKKNVDLTESRAKNARFLSELTKFKVTPTHVIFHCLKVCLEEFSGPNLDILATLLETCGRYLLRTQETSAKMRSMLEMLRRKRAAVNLDSRQLLLLDNAYYHCNPPERKAIEQKVRTPMQMYIRHLIYDVLSKKTVDHVVMQLRKLHWQDAQVLETLKDVFCRAWRIKFSNIHLLAILIYDLERYRADFTVEVIDQVLENIRIGMEQNIFKHNQRRVASICYLGELYNYRLINSSIIFDQLWSLTTFGHPNGRPLPGRATPLDAPDDYFRIRLVCALLDTCGICFDRGSLRKKLDEFLLFLNLYVLCKEQPLPMEVDFMLTETLESLRPKLVFTKNLMEAATAVDEMLAAHRTAPPTEAEEEDEDESSSSDEDELDDDERGARKRKSRIDANTAGISSDSEASSSSSTASSSDSDSSDQDSGGGEDDQDEDVEDEAMMRRREEELALKKEVQDEFDRELAKMMADLGGSSGSASHTNVVATGSGGSVVSRSGPAGGRGLAAVGGGNHSHSMGGLSEIGLPIKRRVAPGTSHRVGGSAAEGNAAGDNDDDDDGSHMRFSLLSRKGSKQVTHEVKVPSTATIAINTRSKQLQDEAERQHLKKLVLAYERGEDQQQSDHRDLEKSATAARGFHVRHHGQGGR